LSFKGDSDIHKGTGPPTKHLKRGPCAEKGVHRGSSMESKDVNTDPSFQKRSAEFPKNESGPLGRRRAKGLRGELVVVRAHKEKGKPCLTQMCPGSHLQRARTQNRKGRHQRRQSGQREDSDHGRGGLASAPEGPLPGTQKKIKRCDREQKNHRRASQKEKKAFPVR